MTIRSRLKRIVGDLGYDVRAMATGQRDSSQRALLNGREVATIFDVGASIGDTVAGYRRLFPGATVHAFEPLPDCYERLAARFAADAKVDHHQLAITGEPGHVRFHAHEWRTFSSTLTPAQAMRVRLPQVPDVATEIDVAATTLDAFCTEREIDAVAILKLDIQGGELPALRGASELLGRRGVDLIFAEVSFVALYEDQALFDDVMSYLRRFDYVLYNLFDITTSNGFVTQADALFLNPDAVPR